MAAASKGLDLRPVAERFETYSDSVADLIHRIKIGEDDLDLLTQLNLDCIRVARLALLLRDELAATKKK